MLRLIILSVFLSALNLLRPWHWLLEFNTGLGWYYLLLHFVSLLLSTHSCVHHRLSWLRLIILRGFLLVLMGHYLLSIGQYTWLVQTGVAGQEKLRISSQSCLSMSQADSVDLLLLNGGEAACTEGFVSLPHQAEFVFETGQKLVLRSRAPLELLDGSVEFGDGMPPALLADLQLVSGRSVRLVALDLNPPGSQEELRRYRVFHRRLASRMREWPADILLTGRLGAGVFSSFYRKLMLWTAIKDYRWLHLNATGLRSKGFAGELYFRGHFVPERLE